MNSPEKLTSGSIHDAASRILPVLGLMSGILLYSSRITKTFFQPIPWLYFIYGIVLLSFLIFVQKKSRRSSVSDVMMDVFFYDLTLQTLGFLILIYDKNVYDGLSKSIWEPWEIFVFIVYAIRLLDSSAKNGCNVAWPIIGPFTASGVHAGDVAPSPLRKMVIYMIIAVAAPLASVAAGQFWWSTQAMFGFAGLYLYWRHSPRTATRIADIAEQRDTLIVLLQDAKNEMATLSATITDIAKKNNVFDKASALAVLYGAMTPAQKAAMEAILVIDKDYADEFVSLLIAASREEKALSEIRAEKEC